jgi:hypothetical protein
MPGVPLRGARYDDRLNQVEDISDWLAATGTNYDEPHGIVEQAHRD